MAFLKRSGTIPEAKLTLQSRAMGPTKVMIPFFKTSVPILSTPNAFVFLSLEIIRVTSLADMNLKLKPLELLKRTWPKWEGGGYTTSMIT